MFAAGTAASASTRLKLVRTQATWDTSASSSRRMLGSASVTIAESARTIPTASDRRGTAKRVAGGFGCSSVATWSSFGAGAVANVIRHAPQRRTGAASPADRQQPAPDSVRVPGGGGGPGDRHRSHRPPPVLVARARRGAVGGAGHPHLDRHGNDRLHRLRGGRGARGRAVRGRPVFAPPRAVVSPGPADQARDRLLPRL